MPTSQPKSAQAHVLIVEDDDAARQMFATVLRMAGYNERTAADGLAGLRLLEAYVPDVVILDLALPVATGFEVLCELRSVATTRHTPVIAISGHEEGLKRAKANPDCVATIPKPFDPQTLVRAVDRAVRQLQT